MENMSIFFNVLNSPATKEKLLTLKQENIGIYKRKTWKHAVILKYFIQ